MSTCSDCNFVILYWILHFKITISQLIIFAATFSDDVLSEVSEALVIICSSCVIGMFTELKNVFKKNLKYNEKANKIK